MASAVASKGAPLAGLLKELLLAAPSASASGGAPVAHALSQASAAARRLFSTEGAPLRRDDYDLEESSDDDDAAGLGCRARNLSLPMFFSSDVLDPFGPPTSLGWLLALMEGDASAATGTAGFSAAAPRRGWWVSKEDDAAVQLKVPMPGLGKEHVKVWAEQNIVMIKGEGDKESEGGDDDDKAGPLRYSRRIELPADAFKVDQVRAEMKNGLLKVTVPKLKKEERKDVFQVKVE